MLRKNQPLVYFAFFLLVGKSLFAQPFYDELPTTKGNFEMTISNLGNIGNSFRGNYQTKGWGSAEYPAKSGIEHVFFGGLWVGAVREGVKLVTTGAVGTSNGYQTGGRGFEFTATPGSKIKVRSTLFDDPNFDPQAVSHQDFVSDFTDKNILIPGSSQQISDHTQPLNIDVRLEAYNWNYNSANFFVPLTFTIKNNGDKRLDSVFVGYWCDFVIRNVKINPPGGTPFFASGGNGFFEIATVSGKTDTLMAAYEYDADDAGYNAGSYIGLQYLGAVDEAKFYYPGISKNFRCNYNTWLFSAGSNNLAVPTNDQERYFRLRLGHNNDPNQNWNSFQQQIFQKGNRSNLLSVGPFASLEPGQSVSVTFALVCASTVNDGGKPNYQNTAKQQSAFLKNLKSAKSSYAGIDLNRNSVPDDFDDRNNNGIIDGAENGKKPSIKWVFPAPPDVPKIKIIATDNLINIYWANNSENSIDPVTKQKDFEGYRIYKTQLGFDVQEEKDIQKSLQLLAQFDVPANKYEYNTGFQSVRLPAPVSFESDTVKYMYLYSIVGLANGWQHGISVTAFDRPNDSLLVASQETNVLVNLKRVFPGKPANESLATNMPFVYPNPYYGIASWEGNSRFEEDRKLIFSNLPAMCKIKIYTYAGDLIDEIDHDVNYNGGDLGNGVAGRGWYNAFSDTEKIVFSGGEHGWDLLSRNSQLIARGMYLFTVEDKKNGKVYPGKFVVIK